MKAIWDSFWFAHGAVAICTQLIVAVIPILLGFGVWQSVLLVALFTTGCYVGRERHQAEVGSNSRHIMPWDWSGNPKALKDIGVPTILVTTLTILAFYFC
jgi:uncharacterized membrane protein